VRPAFIEFVQTFGDLVNFHPHVHVHVLAVDGVFRADGAFLELPPIPEALLDGGFRRAVLDFLVEERAISEELRGRMLGWRYSGLSVHNQVRVAADDAEGRNKLAGYMRRAPLSLAKMSYDAASGTVIYRSKMHLGLKRNCGARAAKNPVPATAGSGLTEALSEDPVVVRAILTHLRLPERDKCGQHSSSRGKSQR
jgi:hypothetical protein